MSYSRLFGSKYPTELIELGNHKDVDNSIVSLINQYNYYVKNNDTANASKIYNENKELLKPYILNTEYINFLEEEIYNTGLFAMATNTSVITDTEPASQDVGSYWLLDY